VNSSPTRFFCRCGRLITADATTREVVCPTCKTRNSVPGLDAALVPPPIPSIPSIPSGPASPPAPSGATSPAQPPASGAATAILDLRIGARLGRFELVRVVGHGGMGTVYHAREDGTGRDVALKVLHPVLQSRPDFVSRFQREARAASALNHENIVRVLDSGIERGTPWIAMELLEGEDLLASAQRGIVNPVNAPLFMLQAARGLAAASAVGITHRDVKPGNLVLRRDGVLKIADFGLAKEVDSTSHLTVTGEVLGTPHYMSPEQGRGDRADHRSDLYSLGATFYHVLGGAPPHEAETPVGVIMKHLREEPVALRARNPNVAPGLERVVHRLLQKSPDQRYQSYQALAEDLERVARGNDPIAGADPPGRRVQQGDTTYLISDQLPNELVLKPAGAIRRLLALFVDVVAVDLVLKLCFFLAYTFLRKVDARADDGGLQAFLWPRGDFEQLAPEKAQILTLALLLGAFVYFVSSDSQGGRTIGKRWFNLRICRRDGGDLGVVRSFVRTLLVLPGIVLLVPMSACAVAVVMAGVAGEMPYWSSALLGLGWIFALHMIGNATAGRPLQDALVGAHAYRAERRKFASVLVSGRRDVTPGRALRLSLVPGLGVMYAGRVFFGLVFMAAIVTLLVTRRVEYGIGLWVLSAAYAHRLANRPPRDALDSLPPPAESVVRRQES
jgi:uncharacterized RDD family membrane protein YckC